MHRSVRHFAVVIFLLLLSASLFAQSTTSLRGVVTDAKGAVLPGATVAIHDAQTGFTRTVTSGGDGSFTAPLLPVGQYTVSVHAPGFSESTFRDIVVRVTETTRLIAKLKTVYPQFLEGIRKEKALTPDLEATLKKALDEVSKSFA